MSDLHTNGTANRAPTGAQDDIVEQLEWHTTCVRNADGLCLLQQALYKIEHQQAEIGWLRDRSCSTCVHGRKRPAEAYEPDCYSCAGVLKGNSFAMPFYCFSYEEARRA
jgi:hypothetical protein